MVRKKVVEVVHDGQPSVVAVYEFVATEFERVAEFRLTAAGTVELILDEPDGCPLAQEWFDRGLRLPGRPDPVIPADGPAFLEAVLRPRRMSYCRVVDESAKGAEGPGPGTSARQSSGGGRRR